MEELNKYTGMASIPTNYLHDSAISQRQRFINMKADMFGRINEINEIIEIFDKNPELERLLDLVRKF